MSTPMNEAGRFAPPRARIAEPDDASDTLAGRGTRLGAALIDVAIAIACFALLSLVLPWNPFLAKELTLVLLSQLMGLVAFFALHGALLVRHGQTIGKRLLKIRIVRPDGRRATAARVLGLRYGIGFVLGVIPLVGVLYAIADCLFIFGRRRRCLHDLIADTIVVRA